MTIAVAASPLLDLGHEAQVQLMRFSGSRVLSLDVNGYWELQDFTSGDVLASGNTGCTTCLPGEGPDNGNTSYVTADLAGSTMMDFSPAGLEVRAISDGHVLATLPGQETWWQLASDGSYVVAGSPTALTAWTSSGQALFSRSGDYSKAIAFSAPGKVLVALGPAGQNVIETVSTTGTSTVSPAFQGSFNAWFQDGSQFLTATGFTVWVYSNTATQEEIIAFPNVTGYTNIYGLGGEGNWFWYNGGVYQVGGSQTPVLTAPGTLIPSGLTVGVLGTNTLSVLDLSGTTPVLSSVYQVPIAYLTAFAASSATTWVVGNLHGVVLDGTSLTTEPRYLTLGAAWSIAGGTGYVAVATASGSILVFNPATNASALTINFSSSQLASSTTGAVLAAAANSNDGQYETDRTLNIYSLPSGSLINSFPSSFTSSTPTSLASMLLSGSGTVVEQSFIANTSSSNNTRCPNEVIATTGGTPIFCGSGASFALSPDGTLFARNSSGGLPTDTTDIFQNGTLATTVPGDGVGWLDNGHLLVYTYSTNSSRGFFYAGAVIYSPSGQVLSKPQVPELHEIQVVSTDQIYSPISNAIVSVTTGATSWASANNPTDFSGVGEVGAVAGSEVVFASGNLVLAQPY